MTEIKQNLTLDGFAEHLCSKQLGSDLGRVEYKFVRSMLMGVQRARSVNLTDIAKELDENIRLHATHKRLSRNLDNPALEASLSDRMLMLGAAKVRPDTRLIVHLYELNKKYARKVEFLPEPGPDLDAGFKVCEIIASDPDSDTYTALLTTVWSDKVPDYVDDAEEVKKALDRVVVATGNKGIMYFDDLSMSAGLLLSVIEKSNFNFIAVISELEMDVLCRNETCSLQSVVDSVETPYGRTLFKMVPEGAGGASKNTSIDLFMHAGVTAIKLPDCDRNLRLIALKSKNRVLGEMTTPMITSQTNLRSRKALMGLVESFLSVQDVQATHQARRDSFGPASFRVLTYNRLQLLMTLLQLVIHYEVSVSTDVAMSNQRFSVKPHGGDPDRTYLMPKIPKA